MSQTESTNTGAMLSIARSALEGRAKLDGYEPGDYDLERDPEGYVTSLLNALRHWCHAEDLHWETELLRADDFFFEDIRSEQFTTCHPQSLEELRCPECGHTDSFLIEVGECVLMFADGTDLHGDEPPRWDDRSFCRCHECDFAGTAYQFWKRQQKGKEVNTHG